MTVAHRRGSLWKTSWQRRPLLDQLPAMTGFGLGLTEQYYVDPTGSLDIVPSSRWFVGAVVSVAAVPAVSASIARNGNVANEGWEIELINGGGSPAQVKFRLTVYDGVGVAAQAETPLLSTKGLGDGLFGQLIFTILAAFQADAVSPPNGRISISEWRSLAASDVALATPYVNTSPRLTVGVGSGISGLSSPNALVGLVGGAAPWSAGALGSQVAATVGDWQQDVRSASQVVAVPNTVVPGLVTTHGWRAPESVVPGAPAGNPLSDFVGVTPLSYGNGSGGAGQISGTWVSGEVFYPDNLAFPYV